MADEIVRKKPSKYQKLQSKLTKKFDSFYSSSNEAKEILASISHGQNRYFKSSRVINNSYDPHWLDMIEDTIPQLGEIIKNPRKVTKTVTEIVPVELAKKTNAESVRHLASHTQYVKSVDEEGNITPNKVLNIATDDDYAIYENKFIATLVRRLLLFVEKRYDFMTRYAPLKDTDVLMLKSTAVVDGSIVEIETKVKITKKPDEVNPGETNEFLKRIEEVRRYLMYYYNSDFMKMFKAEKSVRSPIILTNIIRKNPLYNKCYKLYRYIENYSGLGIDYRVKESYTDFSKEGFAQVNNAALAAFLAVNSENPGKVKLQEDKVYKPRVLKSIDDDAFIYAPVSNKPLEFIRVDEQYFKDLRRGIGEIKLHPTKYEAAYQDLEVAKKKAIDNEEMSVNKLLKRKEKEMKEFEAKQAKLAEQEAKRLEKLKAKEELEKQKQAEAVIEEVRKDIKNAAIDDRKQEEEKLNNGQEE